MSQWSLTFEVRKSSGRSTAETINDALSQWSLTFEVRKSCEETTLAQEAEDVAMEPDL